jgi:negative regulator of sigma E activity
MRVEDRVELLSAFLDGEEIPPGELAQALAEPEAREYLRDFASMRNAVRADETRPSASFYESMEGVLSEPPARLRHSRVRSATRGSLLAAAVVLAAILGVIAGLEFNTANRSDAPPEYDRRVDFVRGVDWEESR